jgi:Ca2+-binding RTX toxin-like protein
MTYYYDQSNRVIDGATEYWAFPWSLNGTPVTGPIIVTPLGVISHHNNGAALYLDNGAYKLTVNGLISADVGAYTPTVQAVGVGIVYSADTLSTIKVGSTGTIFGSWAGIDSHHATNITNSGAIGGHVGIRIASGTNFTITNSGLVYSTEGAHALELFAGKGFTVKNTGEIQGGIYGGSAYASRGVGTIANSGMIGGDISILSGVSKITNSAQGIIDGSMSLWSGNDTLTNRGLVRGLIELNGGADKFVGGSFSDNVAGGMGLDNLNGGAGSDTLDYSEKTGAVNLVLNGAKVVSQLLDGVKEDRVSNFENVTGGSGADVLTGDGNANIFNGNSGTDTLSGGLGNDTLIGGADADVLIGGAGTSDTASYSTSVLGVTVNLSDGLVEVGGDAEGDSLNTIENITGTGQSDTLTGDGNANILTGLAGADILNGGLGNDTLVGGTGSDTFVFDMLLGATNVDSISDFSLVDDVISLENSIFVGLAEASTLASDSFVNGLAATAATAQILYNQATGDIYFDADGNTLGGQSAIKFAHVTNGHALSFDDFTVT